MSLADYVHAMGRGPSRARSLDRTEAADAMRQMLAGTAAPEAVGALLMLMRFRGETANEVAGFTDAARESLSGWQVVPAALDWPSYAAGRSRGLPWFLLSALLVARAGYPVILHGWNSHQGSAADVSAAVTALTIERTETPQDAQAAVRESGIAYIPLEALDPRLLGLLRLRDVLGLRSAVNTVCRMLNPCAAAVTVQGVFHPSYRNLQQDAAGLLGQSNLVVIKGGGGEFERNPAKSCALFGLQDGEQFEEISVPIIHEHRRLAEHGKDLNHLLSVWQGDASDPWAEAIVIGTAALALRAILPNLGPDQAIAAASLRWQRRRSKQPA